MNLTDTQLQILQHTLGLDGHGQPPANRRPCPDDEFPGCYRNNFYAGPGHSDWEDLQALTASGLMTMGRVRTEQGDRYFSATKAGYDTVKLQSPPPPKLSRAKRRWQQFREWHDAYNGTFPEFLQWMKTHSADHGIHLA
jgi:hypothetical protein